MRISTLLGTSMVALALSVASASAAGAQERGPDIPKEARPPAGMCRIWLDNVPAGQQPAPTDCATAVKNRPAKGRVVFGDKVEEPKGKTAPWSKSFTPPRKIEPKRPPLDSL